MAETLASLETPGASSPETPQNETAEKINSPEAGKSGLEAEKNEPSGSGNFSIKGSVGEKIRGAVTPVFEKFSIPFRKGRGRPRNDGLPGKADVPLAPAPVAAAPSPVADSPPIPLPVDNFLLRRVVVSAVKGAKSFARYLIRGKARRAGLEDSFIERTLDAGKPEAEAWSDFEQSLGLVLKKYNIKTEHDELLACGADLVRLFAADIYVMRALDAEIERRQRKEIEERRLREDREERRKAA